MKGIDEDIHAIQNAVNAFYLALQGILDGDALPMENIWSHAKDVSYLGPQGKILIGRDQILSAWREQAKMGIRGTIKPGPLHTIIEGNIAIIQNDEQGTNHFNGKKENVHIRATTIFRLEDGTWKLISHHTDLIPSFKN